jgi:hypothetical protein
MAKVDKPRADPTGTKSFALSEGNLFLDWDYTYTCLRAKVFGAQKLASFKTICDRTGHDERWAYKMLNAIARRVRAAQAPPKNRKPPVSSKHCLVVQARPESDFWPNPQKPFLIDENDHAFRVGE